MVPPPRPEHGPTITSYRAWRDDGRHRLLIGDAGLPLNGLPLPSPMRRRLADTAVAFGIGRETGAAHLRLDGPALRATAARSVDPELYAAMEAAQTSLGDGYGTRRSQVGARAPAFHDDRRVRRAPSRAHAVGAGDPLSSSADSPTRRAA